RPGVELAPVFAMGGIVGKMLRAWVRITGHAMKWQWLDRPRVGSVSVRIFGPSIDQQQKISLRSWSQGRKAACIEQQAQFVSRSHDHRTVIGTREKFTHIAIARVKAGRGIPHRGG